MAINQTRLIQFGETGSTQLYTFPTAVQLGNAGFDQDYTDNMGNLVPKTTRLPSMDGGFDEYGDDPAPSEIGSIKTSFYLVATSRDQMTAKRDAARQMLSFGKRRLFMQPSDPALSQRWCWARLNDLTLSEERHKYTDLFQKMVCTWQVSDPHWYSDGTENSSYWGDQIAYWGDGVTTWGGTGTPIAVSGTSTSITVTTTGSGIAIPRIILMTSSVQTVQNPTIQRLVNGVVIDEVSLTDTLSAASSLIIDCRKYAVQASTLNAYNNFSYLTPWWFRLLPGANTLRVLCANAGDACTIRFAYYETWY